MLSGSEMGPVGETPARHPGAILFETVMQPLGVSRNRLARAIDVPVGRISDIVNGKRGITPDTALRLAKFFGTTAELWMRLQTEYDLYVARRDAWPEIDSKVGTFSAVNIPSSPTATSVDRAIETPMIALSVRPPPKFNATNMRQSGDHETSLATLKPRDEPAALESAVSVFSADDDAGLDPVDVSDTLDIPDPGKPIFK